jgi:hypothetical protein
MKGHRTSQKPTKSVNRNRIRKKRKRSWRRLIVKTILGIALICILSIYQKFLSRIMMEAKTKTNDALSLTIPTRSKSMSASTSTSKAVMIIAAVPFHSIRSLSLWSQLECFSYHVDKVVITAADYSKEILDPFIAEAVSNIPHLRDGSVAVEVKYFNNDRYDMGLWCDALNSIGVNEARIYEQYDHYLLTNDSLMAIQKSSEVIDMMRSRNLTMGSLTYSLLGDGYWLEAVYRGFNSIGIRKFMEHTCIPNPCEKKKHTGRRHRCMVDTFEIPMARYFDRKEVYGLYHGDAPIEYFNATAKNKKLQTR